MNPLQRGGVYRPLLNRCYRPLNIHKLQTRKVSKQVWDCFGFLKDGTDLNKRASCAWYFEAHPVGWRVLWGLMLMGPAHFLFWCHGAFDYIFRRRTIPPFPVQYDAEYPWRYMNEYMHPCAYCDYALCPYIDRLRV